ncbi:MAG TPA: thioredoxin [Bacteroidetes bacterium]|nr:thioredoxin [Bacteroidota bacterium]
MKKRLLPDILLLVALWVIVPFLLRAQELNKNIFSAGANQEILIGYGNREGMEQDPFNRWFDQEYSSYQLNDTLIKMMASTCFSDVNITIVLGTWCSDSRREVPRFFKVADALKIPEDHIRVIFVDRDKTSPEINLTKLKIDRVPVFIFYFSGKEAGRIIERPEISLEADMKNILTKK